MKNIKKRWPNKKNGLSRKNYCQGCLSFGCDPFLTPDTIAVRKRLARRKAGLCEGCGKNKCSCKKINKR